MLNRRFVFKKTYICLIRINKDEISIRKNFFRIVKLQIYFFVNDFDKFHRIYIFRDRNI